MKTKAILVIIPFIVGIMTCKSPSGQEEQKESQSINPEMLKGTLVLSGAYALSPAAIKWAAAFQKKHPEVKVKVYETGTGQGIKDLLDKKASLAMISRDVMPDENKGVLWKMSVARDGVGLIINKNNPFLSEIMKRGFTQAELVKIFTSGRPILWSEYVTFATPNIANRPMTVCIRSDNSGAAEVWANFLLCTQADLKGIGHDGDQSMINAISKNENAIGFCNLNYAFNATTKEMIKDVQIVPIDLDANGKIDPKEKLADNLLDFERNVWAGKYPRCLCRYLYLASVEKPVDPIVVAFLRFSQGEGQEIITSSGLCKLNSIEVENNLKLLE